MSGIPSSSREFQKNLHPLSAVRGEEPQTSESIQFSMEEMVSAVGTLRGMQLNPFSAALAMIIESSLTAEYQKGKQYSSLNSYRPALFGSHPQIDGYDTLESTLPYV